MKRILYKQAALSLATAFLVAGPAFANQGHKMKNMTSSKTLKESTNSGVKTNKMSTAGQEAATNSTDNTMANTEMGSMKAIPHLTINFEPGSAVLSASDRDSLKQLVNDARAKGDIDQVTVAAWSDKALPTRGKDLMESDRDLATKRADAISSVLKSDMQVGDVDTYNMAEHANWLARTFDTREAELKSIFGKRGTETPITNEEFHVIKTAGGPSSAVIVVEKEKP